MQIYWNKRKRLHKKRVQLPHDWFGTKTWPPFHCFGTQIWPPWSQVKTHNKKGYNALVFCRKCPVSGIRWRHRTAMSLVGYRWRLGRAILMISYYAYMTYWSKARRSLREESSQDATWSFLSLVAAVSGRNWTQNPIVKGKNFLFLPLLLVECFLTVLGETNSQEISINRPGKWNLLIRHICEWVHKLQEFNFNIGHSNPQN